MTYNFLIVNGVYLEMTKSQSETLKRPDSKYLNVLSNSTPVVCSHIGGVQQRAVLYDSVDYPLIAFTQPGREELIYDLQ